MIALIKFVSHEWSEQSVKLMRSEYALAIGKVHRS